ncbi:MAG: CbtA family protein [Nitratireductor sp.]
MLVRVLLAAIFAGVAAGIFATAVQSYRVIPLILQAETYEDTDTAAHDHSAHDHVASEAAGQEDAAGAAHDHGEAWTPANGVERTFYTALANVVVGVAFSLLLLAGILVSNQAISLRSGLVWGAAGFVVFVLAPNFGLPPELPGMATGELVPRQIWWLATVAMTAAGLALFTFQRSIAFMVLGIALIVGPHLYGAPQPASHASAVPANLAAEFAVATIVASLLFWLFLGGLLGSVLARVMQKDLREDGPASA